MTPEERAEMNVSLNRDWNTDEQIRKQIAAEIRAAVEEEHHDSNSGICEHCQRYGRAVGMSLAYENAAKIAEEFTLESFAQKEPAELWLANKIRARAAEVSSGKSSEVGK